MRKNSMVRLWILICVGLVVMIFADVTYVPKNCDAGDVVSNSLWDGGVSQVKRYLKRNLKDPGSLNIIEWSPVASRSDGGYQVRCKYRAKNSFGGYVIANQIFIMDAKGNVIRVVNY